MSVVDRRQDIPDKSSTNRQKFLDRFKRHIKEQIKQDAARRKIKNFKGKLKIKINKKSLEEPSFQHDYTTGTQRRVHVGNKKFSKNHRIPRPDEEGGRGSGAGRDCDGEDEFEYLELSEEEWRNLLFEDMELPDFIKQSLKKDVSFKKKRAGFIKEGIPSRLDVGKTYEMSFARRLVLEMQGLSEEEIPFIEDVDLRYRHYKNVPVPIKSAVMFCVMDVSGSMGEHEKHLAKMFFLLLHLFLTGAYEQVEIVFIRHTDTAKECDEQEFFYSRHTGGTEVLSALQLVKEIIDTRYDTSKTNIYIAQASDGDCFGNDGVDSTEFIYDQLLHKIQYFAYVEVGGQRQANREWQSDSTTLLDYYEELAKVDEKFNVAEVERPEDVFPVLQQLFKKR